MIDPSEQIIAKALIASGDTELVRRAMAGEITAAEAMLKVAPSHLQRNGEVGRRLPKDWSTADHALFIALAILRDRP